MNIFDIELPVLFTDPWWLAAFALLPPLIVLGLWQGPARGRRAWRGAGDRWRPRASTLIRALILSLVVLALAGLQVVQSAGPLSVVYLVDVSDSVSAAQQDAAFAYVTGGAQAKGADDRVGVVLFGEHAAVARPALDTAEIAPFVTRPPTTATNIAEAIQLGLALLPDAGRRRLVLISDGLETAGQARDAARLAGAGGVPIDVVPFTREATNEVSVAGVGAPSNVPEGQQFEVKVVVQSSSATTARVRLFQDDALLEERDTPLARGNNTLTFPVEPPAKGFHAYRAEVSAVDDRFAANNTAAGYAIVTNAPKVLIAAGAPADGEPLQKALEAAHVEATIVAPDALPKTLPDLTPYDTVVLANVGADVLDNETEKALQVYVRDLGRGLLMIGGEASFGAGGYLRSPLEEALPVTMDVKAANREASVALALVVDKSGSMGRCHCGGSGAFRSANVEESGTPKVDIAKEAILRASETLTGDDRLAVVTFDTEARWVVNLQPLRQVPDLAGLIAGVQAEGQTNIFSGLRAAADALEASDARVKHMILLSDGWSDQGQYNELLAEMRSKNITLSAISAGSGSAPLLEQLAALGGGRFYPAPDMDSVPQLFLKDATFAAGSYITEGPFVPAVARGSPILKGIDPASLPRLLGYNNSTAKPTGEVILASPGGDPILAQWQYGLGRAVAWTSDAKGRWAVDWVQWPQFPTFMAQMVGWTLPREISSGVTTEISTEGTRSTIRVDSTDTSGAPRNFLQTTVRVTGPDQTVTEIGLPQRAPGRYEGTVQTAAPGAYLVEVTQTGADGSAVAADTTGLVIPYSAEYRVDAAPGAGMTLLQDVAAASGGRVLEIDAPAAALGGALPARPQRTPLWPLLLTLALLLFPLDVAVRRLTMTRGDLVRGWRAVRAGLSRGPRPPPADDNGVPGPAPGGV